MSLSPAAAVVEEVLRRTVAGHHAPDRDFGVPRVRAAERAVGVVEDQLDTRPADRFANTGAVEYHVGHRVAAKCLCRTFPQYPADGVDDVGLAAPVGTDDAHEVAGKAIVVGSTKDLKPESLILLRRIQLCDRRAKTGPRLLLQLPWQSVTKVPRHPTGAASCLTALLVGQIDPTIFPPRAWSAGRSAGLGATHLFTGQDTSVMEKGRWNDAFDGFSQRCGCSRRIRYGVDPAFQGFRSAAFRV